MHPQSEISDLSVFCGEGVAQKSNFRHSRGWLQIKASDNTSFYTDGEQQHWSLEKKLLKLHGAIFGY